MIIVEMSAGLGNQMYQYAFAKGLAKKKNDLLLIDTKLYRTDSTRNYQLNKFNISCVTLNSANRIGMICRKIAVFLSFKKTKLFVNEPIWEYPDFIDYKAYNISLLGTWAFSDNFESIRDQLSKEFSLKKQFRMKIQPLMEKLKQENSVSIHVRRGDYLNSSTAFHIFNILEDDYYLNAIEIIESTLDKPKYYLFTDDIKSCAEMLKDRNVEIISLNDSITDYEEFELMKSCRHHIIANSTFSWWAAWLGKSNDGIIIQPHHWYKDKELQTAYENGKIIGKIGISI